MNATIVYFSQTGNTSRVAEAMADALTGAGCDTAKLVPLEEAGPEAWTDCDLFLLGTPVFYYREPRNVGEWIRRLPPRDGPVPTLTFITHGGNPTNTLARLRKRLRKKGARVTRSFDCHGFDTYPIYLKSFRQWGHPDAADLNAAGEAARAFVDDARRLGTGEDVPEPSYPFVGGKTFRLSLLLRRPLIDWLMPTLEADRGLCTKCGACVRACPTDNITLGPWPEFANRCIRCYLCERICPHNAIQCDWTRLRKMMGEA